MAKLFNFRCSDELMAAIEKTANAQSISKSEAATALIRLGLQALNQNQDTEIPAPERKTNYKTVSNECKTVESGELSKLEERLTYKTKEMIEVSYAAAMGQLNGMVEILREEIAGELSA